MKTGNLPEEYTSPEEAAAVCPHCEAEQPENIDSGTDTDGNYVVDYCCGECGCRFQAFPSKWQIHIYEDQHLPEPVER